MHCFDIDTGEFCRSWDVRGHMWWSSMEPVVDSGEVYLALTEEEWAKLVKVRVDSLAEIHPTYTIRHSLDLIKAL